MATELDFCRHLLQKFLGFWNSNKAPYLEVFLQPVDEVRDNAPGYYETVPEPMDLATMGTKLTNGLYVDASAFKADFDLIITNCHLYNVDDKAFVKKHADRLERELEWEWSGMTKWMTAERRRLSQAVPAPPPAALATASTTTTVAATTSAAAAAASAAPMAPNASTSGSERYVLWSPT
jgi:transcription initiation factor TFIID subunit 2